MIKVYQSETGQYVVVHEFSHTVIIDDDLPAAFEKMKEHIKTHHPDMAKQVMRPFERGQGGEGSWRKATLVAQFFLILLPFLWLGILHFSLGSLINEYQEKAARNASAQTETGSSKAVDALSVRIDAVEKRLTPAK